MLVGLIMNSEHLSTPSDKPAHSTLKRHMEMKKGGVITLRPLKTPVVLIH